MPVRIVATADNHLSRFHARMTPLKLEERRRRLRAGLDAAVSYAVREQADLFLMGGDTFDSPSPTNSDLRFVAECLGRLRSAGIATLGVGGNHDTPSGRTVQGGVAPLAPLADLGGITYFGTPDLQTTMLRVRDEELCIGGVTPMPGHNPIDPLEALLGPGGEAVQVFLTHGAIEGHGSGGAEPVLRKRTAATLPRLRLTISGHIHAYATERAGAALLVAPGATEWMTHGETGSRPGFVDLTLDGGEVREVRHITTSPQPRVTLELDLTHEMRDPHETALESLEAASSPDTLMRFRILGTVSREQYVALKLRQLQEQGEAFNFHFDLDATQLMLRDEFSTDVVRGLKVSQPQEISLVADELMASSESEEDRAWWRDARDELLRHYQ